MATSIMQGDAYPIRILLKTKEGVTVTPSDVSDVEITIGGIRKSYADGDVTFDDGAWIYPLTQDVSFRFVNRVRCQARVKFVGSDVIGRFIDNISVVNSDSKEVL